MSPRRHRPGRFRFETSRTNRELLGALLIQGVVQLLLMGALGALFLVSIRMVRTHFVEKYGFQAWILPIIIALMTLFILFRFSRFWRAFMEDYRAENENQKRE